MASSGWWPRAQTILRVGFGVGLLVYVLRAGGSWDALRQLFSLWWLVLLINVVPFIGAAIEAKRLGILFGAAGLRVPFFAAFRVIAIATLFNLWVPGGTGGDVMKLYYLRRLNTGRTIEVATTLLVDRLVALFSLLALISGLLLAQVGTRALAPMLGRIVFGLGLALLALLVATLLVWSRRARRSAPYRFLVERLPLGQHLARAADAAYAFRAQKGALVAGALYSFAGHSLLAATLAISGRILVPGTPPLLVTTLSLLGLIANVIPVTPGGVGIGEAAAEGLFRSIGVSGGAAMVASWRAGLVGLCLAGAAFYAVGEHGAAPAPLEGGRPLMRSSE